jgi:hypothetical protein
MKIMRWDRLVRYAANINSNLLQEVLLVSPLPSWSHLSWTRLAVALLDMELPAVYSPSFAWLEWLVSVFELKPIMWCTAISTANFLYKKTWDPKQWCLETAGWKTERVGQGGDKHFVCKTRMTNFYTANILRWALVNAVMNLWVP